ncbi:uncharacterized protein BDCG_06243 [Blastomyces dermatitidis ER-3]|uniref:C2H2-type domain-containing protein n=1 Tax=Ajellomyces dermatitidis (strain ER-3 / ATCC MYA-2586) TaxID=559297 RepID=A0ABP2F2R3_AJEDR|nr:uncharacterized protein BDCG_06243 [Blastomyces dermatitidis ER-3]EEQ91123.2 hypothetical protein BDCG_06243 [Blastomyces dermatitidis ER-3]
MHLQGTSSALIGSFHQGASPCWHEIPSLAPQQLEASIRLAQPIPLFASTALKTIEYLQENPSIFQFDPDPKEPFTEGFIDPRVLTLSRSPEVEEGAYYNSPIPGRQQDITQDDAYYSLSESSLDYSSSYLAGCEIEDFLRCTADEAQPATTRHLGSVHGESFPGLVKRYRCPSGDYETSRGENLKRHMEAKHPDEPIPANWREIFLNRK